MSREGGWRRGGGGGGGGGWRRVGSDEVKPPAHRTVGDGK